MNVGLLNSYQAAFVVLYKLKQFCRIDMMNYIQYICRELRNIRNKFPLKKRRYSRFIENNLMN